MKELKINEEEKSQKRIRSLLTWILIQKNEEELEMIRGHWAIKELKGDSENKEMKKIIYTSLRF